MCLLVAPAVQHIKNGAERVTGKAYICWSTKRTFFTFLSAIWQQVQPISQAFLLLQLWTGLRRPDVRACVTAPNRAASASCPRARPTRTPTPWRPPVLQAPQAKAAAAEPPTTPTGLLPPPETAAAAAAATGFQPGKRSTLDHKIGLRWIISFKHVQKFMRGHAYRYIYFDAYDMHWSFQCLLYLCCHWTDTTHRYYIALLEDMWVKDTQGQNENSVGDS